MADYPDYQLVLYHSLKGSDFQLGSGGTTVPTDVDYARGSLPAVIPAEASIKIKLKIYDDQARVKYHDFTNATSLKLYGLPIGSPGVPTLLSTGSLVGVTPAQGEALFIVAKAAISEDWASWPDGVRVWFEIIDADSKLVLWQDVEVKGMTVDPDVDYPESEDCPISFVDAAADVTLDVYPGLQVVRIDAGAGDVTVTLPGSGDQDSQGRTPGRIIVIQEAGANAAKVAMDAGDADGINGYTSTITLGGIGRGLDLVPNSGATGWIHANSDVVIE